MKHLNYEEFISKYSEISKNMNVQFFKFEMLPEYDEFNIDNWSTVDSKKANELVQGVQESTLEWLKDKSAEEHAKYFRVRYIPFPLTKYLLIELSSYATSQFLGSKVHVIEDAQLATITDKLKTCFRDFLLFDDRYLFVIDNPGGIVACKAYYTEDPEEIAPYIEFKNAVTPLSQRLDDFLEKYNLKFINNMPGNTK